MGKIIIDVSHHQDPSRMDYDKLAEQVDWAIIRTQYGSATLDRHYKTHHKEFQKRAVPTAAYAWIRGISIADMEKEATDFYNRTKDLNPTFWWLDVEEKSMSDMRAGTKAYTKKLRELGAKKVGVYIAHHLYSTFDLDMDDFDAIWIPHYGARTPHPTSKPAYDCDLHQYTDVGRLNGYSGNLDLNRIISNKSFEFFVGNESVVKAPNTEVKSEVVSKPKPKNPIPNKIYGDTYTVKSGDNLTEISIRSKVSVDNLVKWNNIEDKNVIHVGQVLKLKAPAAKKSTYGIHKIKSGDTLWELAKKYKTTVAELKRLNGLKSDTIYVGKTLKVPNGKASTVKKVSKRYHEVRSGDTVSELAKKYESTNQQIKAWNNLDSNYTIYVGKTIRVK